MSESGTVYLLHFDEPYKHARHYLGWTSLEVEERLCTACNGDHIHGDVCARCGTCLRCGYFADECICEAPANRRFHEAYRAYLEDGR